MLIGAIGALMLLFTVQNYFGSLAEVEPKAASMFLLVVGLPGLVLLALAWQLAARRVKKA
ncbi:Tetrachloroethene reductive dehalogenase TceA membrane-bound subunit [Dehalococcoides mccartyi]|uniref:Tetrachloroethene reductive dehalogenase TceA membrane-bound subunit n=1 Tax=Dehalococcoides mccartyi TaxID=61435 RepID=A0A328ERB9_9CHLR|nr:Tetrachloroethene reductive dehalogenase TceA membrane-bound subunit [Dehalococcoides mccartyi]